MHAAAIKRYPGIVHMDGTARFQTVSEAANPYLHALLLRVGQLTAGPVLMNSSEAPSRSQSTMSPDFGTNALGPRAQTIRACSRCECAVLIAVLARLQREGSADLESCRYGNRDLPQRGGDGETSHRGLDVP